MADQMLSAGSSARLHQLIAMGFALFILANFLPLPGKIDNNVFYALCALPALIWTLTGRDKLYALMRAYALLWLLLLAIAVSSLLHVPMLSLKPVMYIALLVLALHICWGAHKRFPERLFAWLALLALLALLWSSLQWLWQLHTTGHVSRFWLWGTLHPIRTALLIGCGLAWLWVFVLEVHLRKRSVWLRMLGFAFVLLLMLWTAVVFQTRSLLLGAACFFMLAIVMQRDNWRLLLALLVVLGLAVTFGWHEVLSERGLSYRLAIWLDGWYHLNDVCGLMRGCGDEDYRLAGRFSHVHSAYWSILYVHGLPVFMLFLPAAGWLVLQGVRYKSRWLLVASVGWGGVLTTTGGVVDGPSEYWIYFWMPTLLAMFECRQAANAKETAIAAEVL